MSTRNRFDNNNSKTLGSSNHITNTLDSAMNLIPILSRRYEQLLHTEKYFDCVFHCSGIKMKCHKLILSAASPVFEAMFYGPIQEKNMEIDIIDMSPDIFQLLIHYIYTDNITIDILTLEETIELYYGAEKYLLMDLINKCLLGIRKKLRFSNILPALELSVCLDLEELQNVCVTFFERCCITDPLFVIYLKTNYEHISRECIKILLSEYKEIQAKKQLLWFLQKWCEHECRELGIKGVDTLLLNDLQLKNHIDHLQNLKYEQHNQYNQFISINRSYLKACRPLVINNDINTWKTNIKCDRCISLLGIQMSSRFTPSQAVNYRSSLSHLITQQTLPNDYNENLRLEISIIKSQTVNGDNDDNHIHQREQQLHPNEYIIWSHNVTKKLTKYNCDSIIRWDEGLILSPDIEYQLTFIWEPSKCFGAEYPCSILSNSVQGIQFRDENVQCGSILKGIRFVNVI